jgi:hypothetical protein
MRDEERDEEMTEFFEGRDDDDGKLQISRARWQALTN